MSHSHPFTLNIAGQLMDLSQPRVMGILNVTPDSFYDGFRYAEVSQALRQVEHMLEEGADFIDVGGYSSRPGATDISEEEEANRVLPVIREIRKHFTTIPISIDTFRSGVAERALDAGANLINDITGGVHDPKMVALAAARHVPYIVMHMRGNPQTMQTLANYTNVTSDIIDALHPLVSRYTQQGVADLIIDPGFGFAKTVDQNFELLRQLQRLHILGRPLLVGLSRKSMIWRTLQISPEDALNGTTALHMAALLKGAHILRVHDVGAAKQCIDLARHL